MLHNGCYYPLGWVAFYGIGGKMREVRVLVLNTHRTIVYLGSERRKEPRALNQKIIGISTPSIYRCGP